METTATTMTDLQEQEQEQLPQQEQEQEQEQEQQIDPHFSWQVYTPTYIRAIECYEEYEPYERALCVKASPFAVKLLQLHGGINDWSFGKLDDERPLLYYYFDCHDKKIRMAAYCWIVAHFWRLTEIQLHVQTRTRIGNRLREPKHKTNE